MVVAGVYAIKNKITGQIYVGSSVNVHRRQQEHSNRLRRHKNTSIYLQRAWDKYGEANFEFLVLEQVSNQEQLILKEQYWLEHYRSAGAVYNTGHVAKAPLLGVSPSDETRQKLREARLGKALSKEHKLKLSLAHLGKKVTNPRRGYHLTAEHRRNIGRALKGRRPSEKTIQQGRLAHLGVPVPEEIRQKIRRALLGSNNPNYGKPMAEWIKQKISRAHLGKHSGSPSAETIRKISASLKLYYKNLKIKKEIAHGASV